MTFRGIIPLIMAAAAFPAAAQPSLTPPIDCALGETCHIQNFVDTDPTEGAVDFACGTLSYNAHKGTDFGLASLKAMTSGVDVLASAPGVVRATRDGMPDKVFTAQDEADIAGRDCGNGVVIQHKDGWETQYCHLRQGSVVVSQGMQVAAGDKLGLVGLSGRTQFPHVHLSVRHNGQIIDPFSPQAKPGQCGLTNDDTLWSDPAPTYVPGGLISAGFAPGLPDYADVKAGTAHRAELIATTPALVLWVMGFGSRAGDTLEMTITGPAGAIFQTTVNLDKPQAQYFRATGKRLRAALPPGLYRGEITLLRDGAPIDTAVSSVQIR